MVIQRIQSLFLLLAAVLMGLLCVMVPIARFSDPVTELYVANVPELLVIDAITAVLLFVTIFLFKNLPLQMKMTRICTVMIVLSALFEAYLIFFQIGEGEAKWIGSAIILVCAFISTLLALKGMKKDHRLLTSYDRLR